jgi:hypothetical protein
VLFAQYNYNDHIKENESAGHVEHMGEKKNAHRALVGKPERTRPLDRPRHKREDNIKMHLKEIGWSGMDCIHLTQGRDKWRALLNTIINLRLDKILGNLV